MGYLNQRSAGPSVAVTDLVVDCLLEERPTLEQVPKDTCLLLVDGTLLPC